MIELPEDLAQTAHKLFNDIVVSRAVVTLSVDERERLLGDLDLIRRVVTSAHSPRIALVGDPKIPGAALWKQMCGVAACDPKVHEELGRGRWQTWTFETGQLKVADLRSGGHKAIAYGQPDATVVILPSNRKDVDGWVRDAIAIQDAVEAAWDAAPPIVFVIFRRDEQREVGDFVTMQAVKAALVDAGFPRDFAQVVQLSRPGKLVRALLDDLPTELQFSLARMSPEPGAKRQMAESIVRVAASVNATIATIPLPFASSIPITSVQALMIGGIAWLSGREISPRTIAEFAGAIGLNVGVGFAFRELARALVKLVPVAGSVISSTIAAEATRSLGSAATRYFIETDGQPTGAKLFDDRKSFPNPQMTGSPFQIRR